MEEEKLVCPFCGSEEVYEGSITWINPNTTWEGKRSGESYKNMCNDCDGHFEADFISEEEFADLVIIINEDIPAEIDTGINQDSIEIEGQFVTKNLEINENYIGFELWDADGKIGDYAIDIKYYDKITFSPAVIAKHREKRIDGIIND